MAGLALISKLVTISGLKSANKHPYLLENCGDFLLADSIVWLPRKYCLRTSSWLSVEIRWSNQPKVKARKHIREPLENSEKFSTYICGSPAMLAENQGKFETLA
jgi:hypothetical protein